MDFKKIAENYVKNLNISSEIKLREIENNKDFYYFNYFHPTELYAGNGPIFIYKPDGRFFSFASYETDPKKEFLYLISIEKEARKTFPKFDIQKTYNITINRVLRKMLLIEKLLDLNFVYTKPEVVGSDIFRIPKKYNQRLLEERLIQLPCQFSKISAIKVAEIIEMNNLKKTLEFNISEYIEVPKTNRIERAGQKDLETIW